MLSSLCALFGFASLISFSLAKCPSTIEFVVGTYTGVERIASAKGDGISILTLTSSRFGTSAVLTPFFIGGNPTYVVHSAPYFYTTNEIKPEGDLTAFRFSEESQRLISDTEPAQGGGTTHVSVIRNDEPKYRRIKHRVVLAANYDGAVSSFIQDGDNLEFADIFRVPPELASAVKDPSLDPRQRAPHPHMVLLYRKGTVVPDVGSDIVWYFDVNRRTGQLKEISRVYLPPGNGPRHAALHPKSETIFVLCELSTAVFILRTDESDPDKLKVGGKKLLVDEPDRAAAASCAAIRVSKDGKFLYATVRFRGSKQGVIVGLSLDPNSGDIKEKIGEWPSHGFHPRDIWLIEEVEQEDGCTSFLAIANRDSNSIVLVKRDTETGMLAQDPSYFATVNTPVSIEQYTGLPKKAPERKVNNPFTDFDEYGL